jgi:4-amino-4-deoxychorismate lyase
MILVDGKRTARISALDRGLAYGDGIFRTMAARGGVIPHWSRQYQKLSGDCARIGIHCPEEAALREDVAVLLDAAPECIVKLIVTRGTGGRGYAPPSPGSPVRIAMSFPRSVPTVAPQAGVAVRWCTTRVSAQPLLAGIKHLNRLENVLARREWSGPEFAEGLMLDQAGGVIEGTMSNVFVLEPGRLVTPSLEYAGVAGVQRDRLLDCALRIGLQCDVDRITPARLMAAEQVYLTNSVIGLWWVSGLENRRWRRRDVTAVLARMLDDGNE